MTAAAPRSRKMVFAAIAIAGALAILEAGSFAVIAVTARTAEPIRRTADIFDEQSLRIQKLLDPQPRLIQLDAELGWRNRPGYRDSENRINAQGLRSSREYAEVPGPGVIRVAAFGDSFVYCNEVANHDAWPALMEAMSPSLEVLNYGVGGFGVDQAFLRYLNEGALLSPDVVVIGFAPDDLRRLVNVYRRFISSREFPLIKPRFLLAPGNDLELLPNPAPQVSDYHRYLREPAGIIELGDHDQMYQPAVYENPLFDYSATVRLLVTVASKIHGRYLDSDKFFSGQVFNEESTAFRIQMALFEKFFNEVKASAAVPIVVIFPDRDSIVNGRPGQPRVFDPLLDQLRQKGITVTDLTDALVAEAGTVDLAGFFMPGDHYSPLGNRRVAAALERQITGLMTAHGRSTRSIAPPAP